AMGLTASPRKMRPIMAANRGEALMIMRVFATVVRRSAITREIDAQANETPTKKPGSPILTNCGTIRPRRSAMKAVRKRQADTERQKMVVQASADSSERTIGPPLLHTKADAATRTIPRSTRLRSAFAIIGVT